MTQNYIKQVISIPAEKDHGILVNKEVVLISEYMKSSEPNLAHLVDYHNTFISELMYEIKDYISDNWEVVEDWSRLITHVKCSKSKNQVYYGPANVKMGKISYRRDKASLVTIVLDKSDYDLSVTINGIQFLWVNDSVCLDLYRYIRNELNKSN